MQLDYIEELGRFSRTVHRVMGVVLAAPSALFALLFAVEGIRKALAHDEGSAWPQDPTGDVVIAIFCVVMTAVGVAVYLRGRRGALHPVYALLRDQRHEVVWVTRVTSLGTGRAFVTRGWAGCCSCWGWGSQRTYART